MTARLPEDWSSPNRGARTSGSRLPLALVVMASVAMACSSSRADSGIDSGGVTQSGGGGSGGLSASTIIGGGSNAGGVGGTVAWVQVPLGTGGDGGPTTSTVVFENPAENRVVDRACASTATTAEDIVTVQPADIVFAIDGSSSMAAETAFVQAQMNNFSKRIMDSGIDVRVIVIAAASTGNIGSGGSGGSGGRASTTRVTAGRTTTGICIAEPLGSGRCPDDTHLPDYVHVTTPVASNDALNLFVSTYPDWKQHLREGASKSLVVVTDDNATSAPNNSAKTFADNFTRLDSSLLGGWTFNGVFCFTQCSQAAAVGAVYADLVAQTSGVSGDLCEQNFEPVFNRLAEQIIKRSGSKIACEWELPERSDKQTFVPSRVQVSRVDSSGSSDLSRVSSAAQCGDGGGWYFDSNLNPTKIVACDGACTAMQNTTEGKVAIVFDCENVGTCVATDSTTLSTDTCSWALPKAPSGQDLVLSTVNVRYTSVSGFATDLGKVDKSSDCSNVEDGWYFNDPNRPTNVVACPQTCTQIQAGGPNSTIEVLFGCATAKAPPIIVL